MIGPASSHPLTEALVERRRSVSFTQALRLYRSVDEIGEAKLRHRSKRRLDSLTATTYFSFDLCAQRYAASRGSTLGCARSRRSRRQAATKCSPEPASSLFFALACPGALRGVGCGRRRTAPPLRALPRLPAARGRRARRGTAPPRPECTWISPRAIRRPARRPEHLAEVRSRKLDLIAKTEAAVRTRSRRSPATGNTAPTSSSSRNKRADPTLGSTRAKRGNARRG